MYNVQQGNIQLKAGQTLLDGYVSKSQLLSKVWSGFKNMIGKVFAFGVNTLLSAGISYLASGLVSTVIGKISDAFKDHTKEIIEAANTASEAVNDVNNKYANQKKVVQDLGEEYATLAQGVKDFGLATQSQGSLSTDQYEKFLSISNQLAEVFPSLKQGITEEGDALLNLNGSAATITETLKQLLDHERELAGLEVQKSMPEIWEGHGVQVSDLSDKYNEATDQLRIYQDILNKLNTNKYSSWEEFEAIEGHPDKLREIFEESGLDFSEYLTRNIEDVDYKQLFSSSIEKYKNEVDSYAKNIQAENQKLASYIRSSLQGNTTYEGLTDGSKNLISNVLNGIHYDSDYSTERGKDDWDAVYEDIKNRTLKVASKLEAESPELAKKFGESYANIFNYQQSDLSVDAILKQYQFVKDTINNLDISDKDKNIFLNTIPSDKEISDKLNHVKEIMGENWEESLTSEFTIKDLEVLANVTIDKDKLSYTKDEIQKILSPVEIEPEIKASDAVDAMADIKTAITSLGDLWEQTVQNKLKLGKDKKYISEDGTVSKEGDTNGLAVGYADPALINSVESAFSKFSDELKKQGNDAAVNKINLALADFQKRLIETPNDAEAAQRAINNLITAYIDQTNAIQELDESNKEWSIAQLKAMGITNAEAVVESRLNKTIKKLLTSTKALSKVILDNEEALNAGAEGGEKYEAALSSVATNLTTMFKDAFGEDFNIDLDAEFVAKNLDIIRQAAVGDAEALNQLRLEAGKEIVTHVQLGIDPAATVGIQNQINSLIDGFDIENIEIGTSLDDTPLIMGLNNLVQAGAITRDAMNSILSSIGVEPEIDEVTTQIKAKINDMGLAGTAAEQARRGLQYALSGEITVPSIHYKLANKAIGGKYNRPSGDKAGTGNGNGGNSGSDNKLQEDTKETFDWIEVKIKRLEEAVSRLDEIAGSTYNNWTKRNKALRDEIGKLTEEIEAQEHAQKRYLENANSLKNSNVNIKPTEEESGSKKQYQYNLGKYNAAEKEWNSGKYQKLIREGKLGKDDIERIQNKYLVELINQYTELYQKSVDAGVAANTLRETRKSKYAEQFNNIKAEFEGIISLFEDASTIIDKQIERTEEHGYFVASNYYKKQKELTEKVLADQRSEYAKLVKARDEAVEQGKIDKYSEEWYTMTNDINAVEAAINDSATALVKFDNQIRQLKWDAFDYALTRLDMITTEAEFLNDLLNSQPLFEEDGNYTDRGRASSTLIGIQFDTAMKKAQEYGKAIKEVQADLAKDPNNKNYLEQQEELIKAQQDEIKNAKSLKEAYKDLASEGINKNLEFLQKLIDKYKESLSDAKDLASYQKTINEQTKNISSLERQLAAYAGDDSEEARATIQKLTQSLEDARNNLQETEWDKYISETNDMLDDMYEDYSELLNKRLDNIDELFTWGINDNNQNSENLQTTLNDVATQYGYDITSNFDKIIGSGGTTISDFNQAFTDASASTLTVLGNIYNTILEMAKGTAVQDKVVNEGNTGTGGSTDIGGATGKIAANTSNVEAAKKKAGWKKDSIGWWYQNADGTYPEKKWEKIGDKWYYFNDEGYMVSNAYQDGYWLTGSGAWDGQKKAGWKKDKKGWWYQYANGSYPKNRFLQIDGKMYYFDEKGYMVTGEKTIQGQKYVFGSDGAAIDQQDFTKVKKGYATGTSGIRSSQMAWTQEKGSELIYRATDGAILTPLSRGDMVFTNDMSKALWNLAKNPSLAGRSLTLPSINGTARTINNENEITLVLPNVTNYEEFKSALTKDPKFVNFVQATTIGQALGKGRLNRGNF